MARLFAVGMTILMAASALSARAGEAAVFIEKELTRELGEDLQLAARAAVRLGVRFLNDRQDEVDTGVWFAPKPHSLRERVGYETYTVTRPAHRVPIRERVGYEWRWVTDEDPDDPYAPVGRTRVRRPVYRIVGYREVPAREVQRRRYNYQEKNVAKIIARWLEGTNALALYTLLKTGEPPDSDRVVDAALWLREATLEAHALPDTTFELAFYLASFAQLDREEFGEYTARLLEKLLRGQIKEGNARGLWGMYSVDLDRLIDLQRRERQGILMRERLDDERRGYHREMRGAPAGRRETLQRQIERNEQLRERLMERITETRVLIAELSRDFSRGTHFNRRRRSERIGGDVRFYPGAFYDARRERHGDLAHTHLALFALREAVRHGLFEGSPLRDELQPALARAAATLARLQHADGSWGFGAVSTYRLKPEDLDEDQMGERVEKQREANQPCLSMTAAGLAAMNYIAEIAGRANVRGRFGGTIDKARAAALEHLDQYSTPGVTPELEISSQFGSLYYAFALATALDDPALVRTHAARVPDGMMARLLFVQEVDGSWPDRPRFSFGTPQLHQTIFDYSRHTDYETHFDHKLVNTCFAMLLLAQMSKPTVGGRWNWADARAPESERRLERLASHLSKDSPFKLRWRLLAGDLPHGLAVFVPTLVAGGDAAPEQIDRDRLAEFLDDGGLLVVEAAPGSRTATSFARSALLAMYPDAAFRALPDEHPAFTEVTVLTDPPEVEAAWDGERLLAVFLPERTRDGDGLSALQITQITGNLLTARTSPDQLDRSRIIGPDDWEEVEKDLEDAIIRIREHRLDPPEPEEEDQPEAPDDEEPAAEKEQPAEEPEAPEEAEEEPDPLDELEAEIEGLGDPVPDDDDDEEERVPLRDDEQF